MRNLHYTNSVPKIQPFWKWLGKQAQVQRSSCTEPRVNFLLGFLIKTCGELYYSYVFLEWVKGAGHILTGNVGSGEPYQWRNWTLTSSRVKDCVVFCPRCTEDIKEKPEHPSILFCPMLGFIHLVMGCNLQFCKFLCMACVKTHIKYKHGLFYFIILVCFS